MKILPLLRLAFILLGLGLALLGIFQLKTGLQSQSWHTAPARVVLSEATGKAGHRSAVVMAEYRVGGDIYQCGHVRQGRDNTPEDARRHPVGSAVTVAFDPDQPSRCAMETGVTPLSIALLVLGALFLGAAVLIHRRLGARASAA